MTKNESAMPKSVFHDTACVSTAPSVARPFGAASRAGAGRGSSDSDTRGSAEVTTLAASKGSASIAKTTAADIRNEQPPRNTTVRDGRRENASNQVSSKRMAKNPESTRPASWMSASPARAGRVHSRVPAARHVAYSDDTPPRPLKSASPERRKNVATQATIPESIESVTMEDEGALEKSEENSSTVAQALMRE